MTPQQNPLEKWHATPGGYVNHRCRETCCRTAWAVYTKTRRHEQKAKA